MQVPQYLPSIWLLQSFFCCSPLTQSFICLHQLKIEGQSLTVSQHWRRVYYIFSFFLPASFYFYEGLLYLLFLCTSVFVYVIVHSTSSDSSGPSTIQMGRSQRWMHQLFSGTWKQIISQSIKVKFLCLITIFSLTIPGMLNLWEYDREC